RNPLKRMDLDLSVLLMTDIQDQTIYGPNLCYETGPDETLVLALERGEHGFGLDLADLLEILQCFEDTIQRLDNSVGLYMKLASPATVSLAITLATADPRLAARFGFRPGRQAA